MIFCVEILTQNFQSQLITLLQRSGYPIIRQNITIAGHEGPCEVIEVSPRLLFLASKLATGLACNVYVWDEGLLAYRSFPAYRFARMQGLPPRDQLLKMRCHAPPPDF